MQVFGEPGSGLGRSSAAIIIAARSLASRSVCDDQADSTAQFLDWFKTPMPSWGIFEYYRRRASGRWDQKAQGPLPGAIGMKKPATIAGG